MLTAHAQALEPALPDELPAAVVFDMDGLMLDTERLDRELWRSAVEARGLVFPDALHADLIGRRAGENEERLRAYFGDDQLLADIHADVSARWHHVADTTGLPRKPGLEPLLRLLASAGIPMAVATSTARPKALRSLGELVAHFRTLCTGDEVVLAKPAPDIYLLAAERLGVAPGRCMALEDSPAGFAAAEAAGFTTVLIPDLIRPAQPPRYRCDTLDQVADWVGGRVGAGLSSGL